MTTSRYRVPLASLDAVHVPVEEQVETQPASAEPPEYLAPEDLDRLRLLNDPTGAGRLKVR